MFDTSISKQMMQKVDTTQVNRDFSIQFFPNAEKKHSRFISAAQFVEILGEDLAQKKIETIYQKGEQETVLRFRRGIIFKFISR